MLTGIYPGEGISYTDLTAAKSSARGPTTSELPPQIAQNNPAVLGTTGVIVVSKDCAKGLVVTVQPSQKVGTISVAHDSTHGNITALVLADLADSPTWVTRTPIKTGPSSLKLASNSRNVRSCRWEASIILAEFRLVKAVRSG